MNKSLIGKCRLPGDKSISHRALMLTGITNGDSHIENLSTGQDVQSTLHCMQQLGATITTDSSGITHVRGTDTLPKNLDTPLNCGNSGTTLRLLSGLLAGIGTGVTLTGDASLQKRPMKRIIEPLTHMGASIHTEDNSMCAPLQLQERTHPLTGIQYTLPMASAQVKSAILLAGLFASPEVTVSIIEPLPSRDHTERMLHAMGVTMARSGITITLTGHHSDLTPQSIIVPGDMSSAAFWLVGAAICPGSEVTLEQVSLNPTRTAILDVLKQVGAQITLTQTGESVGEPYGTITLKAPDTLTGDIHLKDPAIPALIDEIPILTILGLFTHGTFHVQDAQELRVKESDRLGALLSLLDQFGIPYQATTDGFQLTGNPHWQVPPVTAPLDTRHDHRLVMALEILNLKAPTPLPIAGTEWANISYPTFYDTLEQLIHQSG